MHGRLEIEWMFRHAERDLNQRRAARWRLEQEARRLYHKSGREGVADASAARTSRKSSRGPRGEEALA